MFTNRWNFEECSRKAASLRENALCVIREIAPPANQTLFNRTPYLRNSLPETCPFSTLISIPLERYETFVVADLTTREFIEYHDCSRRNKDEMAKFLIREGCQRIKIPSNSPLVQCIESGATIKPDINFHGPIPPTKFQLMRLKRLLQSSIPITKTFYRT